MKAEDITDIETARIWAVERDANTNAWWDQQWKRNNRIDKEMKALTERVRCLEIKIVWITAVSATIGGLLGSGGGRLLASLVGN